MLYENMSGYLRGFGLSLVPAILTVFGVCVVRLVWIYTVFPAHRTFTTIMLVYPLSLATTAVLIFYRIDGLSPTKRYQKIIIKIEIREAEYRKYEERAVMLACGYCMR